MSYARCPVPADHPFRLPPAGHLLNMQPKRCVLGHKRSAHQGTEAGDGEEEEGKGRTGEEQAKKGVFCQDI